MRVERVPDGGYAECLPGGAYVVAMQRADYLQSHQGTINLPLLPDGRTVDRVLYVRMAPAERALKFAGQSHAGLGTWVWIERAGWTLDPRVSNGTSGHIWDAAGVLHIIAPGPNVTSQGYRYIEQGSGRLVLGDETYADPSRRIWEYTTHGDVTIGQGEAEALALHGGKRYVLEPGNCRFIRFNRDGNSLAVAIVKPDEAVLLWLTVTELSQFPEQSAAPPVQPPAPPPIVVPPVEPPRPPMPEIPSQIDVVTHVRAAYPTPLGDAHGPFLLELARLIGRGAGLLRKDTGVHIVLPDGTRVSQDIICFPDGRIFDCLQDGEGAAKPAWGEAHGSPVDVSRYYKVAAGPVPPPEPPPVPPPTPPPSDELAELKRYIAEVVDAIDARLTAQHNDIAELRSQAAGNQQRLAALLTRVDKLHVKGSTGRSYGHAHSLDLPVVSD